MLTVSGNELTTVQNVYVVGMTTSDTSQIRSGATVQTGGLVVDAGVTKLTSA